MENRSTLLVGSMSKKIIVTGGEGFIGGHLVQRLLNEGFFVKVIDDERSGTYKIQHKNVYYHNQDVANYKLNCFDNEAVAIFHLANSPRVRRALDYPFDTMKNNIGTTLNVLEMAHEIKCPLYFSTSSSTKYTEAFTNPYTVSKSMCEDLISFFDNYLKERSTLMYYYNVFGPGEADYGEYSTVIRRFKQKILNNEPLVIFGDGTKKRAFTHVYDVVDGMMKMLYSKEQPKEVHFGSRTSTTIQDVADAFNHPIEYQDNLPGEALATACEDPYIECNINVIDYIRNWKSASDFSVWNV